MSLNEKGAFYHLIGDAGGSIAVIVSVIIIEVTSVRVIDPITAAVIAVVVTWSAVKVLRGSGTIFFHKMPLDESELRSHLRSVNGIKTINDFHAWQNGSQITVATAHIETNVETMEAAERVSQQVHEELAHHGVDHVTVELCRSYKNRSTPLTIHTH
jgi:cobalt-zinc-cadmium efflux system protein